MLLFLQLRKKIYLLMFFLPFSLSSFAQQKITAGGNVLGENSIPLAGV